jgi:hypothetical protein
MFDQRQAFILYGSAQSDGVSEAKLAGDPLFQYKDYKIKYDRSRATVTRTGQRLIPYPLETPHQLIKYHTLAWSNSCACESIKIPCDGVESLVCGGGGGQHNFHIFDLEGCFPVFKNAYQFEK